MRITEAAARLGMSARMLRYRELLGLLPPLREAGGPGRAGRHRHFSEADVAAAALGVRIERRYGITPAALAFGLRVLTDPVARADMAEFGRRAGRIGPAPAQALEFEKQRALRLLGSRTGPGAAVRARAAGGRHAPTDR